MHQVNNQNTSKPVPPQASGSGTADAAAGTPGGPHQAKKPKKRAAALARQQQREQLRRDRAQITRSLKRRIFLITALMNLSCLIMVACIYFLLRIDDPGLLTMLWVILVVDVVFLGALTVMIIRHYRLGKQAIKQQRKRQDALRAKRLLRQYAKHLSTETQAQLMQQNSQSPVQGGLGMYLKLKDGELSNAIQFLCMTGRKGELTLQFAKGKRATVFLAGKTVVDARIGEYSGLDALAHMLLQGNADATFYDGREPSRKTVDMPVSQVLLEASVRSDEMAAG